MAKHAPSAIRDIESTTALAKDHWAGVSQEAQGPCLLWVQLSIDRPGHRAHPRRKGRQVDEQPSDDPGCVGGWAACKEEIQSHTVLCLGPGWSHCWNSQRLW